MISDQQPTPDRLATVGVIASQLGVPVHRVEYVVRSRGLSPASRAGNARVFSAGDVARIAAALGLPSAGEAATAKGGRSRG